MKIIKSFEIKGLQSDGGFKWEGYASAYDIIDTYDDIVEKGAFSKQIGRTIPAFLEHKTEIGKIKIVGEDEYGLKVAGELPPDDIQDPKVGKLSERLRWLMSDTDTGSIEMKMSVGFYLKDFVNEKSGNKNIRRIKKGELVEVSLVANPANRGAVLTDYKSNNVLTVDDFESLDIREFEKLLRSGQPLSKELSKRIASIVKKDTQAIEVRYNAIADIFDKYK